MIKKYYIDVLQENAIDYKSHLVVKAYLSTGSIIVECKDFYYTIEYNLFINSEDMEEAAIGNIDIIEYLLNYKPRIMDSITADKREVDLSFHNLIYSNSENIEFDINNYIIER